MSSATAERLFAGDCIPDNGSRWTSVRWGLCFAAMAVLHVGVAWIAMRWHAASEPVHLPPPAAVMIDLAPLSKALAVPPNAVPPGPQQEQVAQPPPPEPKLPPALPPAPPTPVPKVKVPLPPKPTLKPKPPPQRLPTVVREQPRPQPRPRPPAPATTTPPQVEAPPASKSAAPVPGASAPASPDAVPNWQASLLGRLEQFKRYPRSARLRRQQGVVYLRFTMDRRGKVLSARIDRSSGFDVLDKEALALVHRAQPLPPPPPAVPGDPIRLVVPVQFALK